MKEATKATNTELPPEAFLALGAPTLAYIKAADINGNQGYAIFAADGNMIGAAPTRELAFAAARQHDLDPVSVH
jgi:hypothetical protein